MISLEIMSRACFFTSGITCDTRLCTCLPDAIETKSNQTLSIAKAISIIWCQEQFCILIYWTLRSWRRCHLNHWTSRPSMEFKSVAYLLVRIWPAADRSQFSSSLRTQSAEYLAFLWHLLSEISPTIFSRSLSIIGASGADGSPQGLGLLHTQSFEPFDRLFWIVE